MTTGAPLLDGLRSIALPRGAIALVPLGQASFIIRAGDMILLTDPFFSPYPGRLVSPPFGAKEAVGVDAVLCTHEHVDHFDPDAIRAIAAASPRSRFVAPRPIVPMFTDLGIASDRVLGAQPGEPVNLDGVTVHPVPASHGVHPADAYNFGQELSGGLYRYLGYVLDAGARVYHAGDTVHYDGMESWLRDLKVDVALLPINGRSDEREAEDIVGNLDHVEAARLAAEIGADILIPMHYDMFAGNPGYPEKVVEVVRQESLDLTVAVLGRGRPWIYAPARN